MSKQAIPPPKFLSDVSRHEIRTVMISSSGNASGTLANGHGFTTVIPVQLAGSGLLDRLQAARVQITASAPGSSVGSQILSWLLFVFFGWLWMRLSRGARQMQQGVMGVGRSRAKVFDAERPAFTFGDVAGSSFVEMFVGVGAARVGDLFVDEVDAIGGRRAGTGAVVANDEREQTLNQLLSEMDGSGPAPGIVVLAATNRPEILDPALLRPGRSDRQLTIPLPALRERAAILAVHCRGKHLGPDADLQVVARGTPGFSGADLANLANEAAIAAVRGGRDVIAAADFDAARERILLGRRKGAAPAAPAADHGQP